MNPTSLANPKRKRVSFLNTPFEANYPDLLALQTEAFKKLFSLGNSRFDNPHKKLHQIFQDNFPISDVRGNYTLHFLDYTISPPYYTPIECLQQGKTYEVPLKVRFRLTCKDKEATTSRIEEVYCVNIPYMTSQGSFIFKGVERVVISRLQRSYGVFFSQTKNLSGINLYAAKIIPQIGTWLEFSIDMYNVMYAYLDRRKKIPVTLLLRVIGYGTDRDLLQLFDLAEEVKVTKANLEKNKGRAIASKILQTWDEDFIDPESDEVITLQRHQIVLDRNTILDDQAIEKILALKEKKIALLKGNVNENPFAFIYNTLQKDDTTSEQEAVDYIYRQFRNSDPTDEFTAREFIKQLLFGAKRAFLGHIGRYCLNKKLNLDIPTSDLILTPEDIVATIKAFPELISGKRNVEDLDSLVNRIVHTSSDMLENIFKKGVKLAAHHSRETLSNRSDEELTPSDIFNGHYIGSSLNSFLGLDPASQYMDQINVLSELEHGRRLTKLGKDLSQERAGLDMRDVHPSQFGRLCPSSTPEGANIGLVNHFAIYAKIDELGFLQTPYKKVTNGIVDVQNDHYLIAEKEDKKLIAQYTLAINPQGKITAPKVMARDSKGEFLLVDPQKVEYIDVGSDQAFSVAASLIPFMSNTEPGRVTIGSNMQRQALPLLKQEVPIVGTGQEKRVAKNARGLLTAEEDGIVEYVDAEKVIIRSDIPKHLQDISFDPLLRTYKLIRLHPTNQGICVNHTPIVKKGDKVKKGQYLCEGYSVKNGELALGSNLRIAFMAWKGFNFEDSIVISSRLVKEDILTSLHIEEFTVNLHDTKLGPEELTADIPGVSESKIQNLDEHGIIRVGRKVKEGDILVGKITPQSNENPSSEAKLMAAIFGKLAGNVKETSFRAPFACEGTVIRTEILHGQQSIRAVKKQVAHLEEETRQELSMLRTKAMKKLTKFMGGQEIVKRIRSLNQRVLISAGNVLSKKLIEEKIFPPLKTTDKIPSHFTLSFNDFAWTASQETNEKLTYFFQSYQNAYTRTLIAYIRKKRKIQFGYELPPGVIKQAKVYLAKKCKIEVGDKLSGRHGNKGVVSKIVPEEDMPYHEDGSRVDIILSPLSIPSRMNIGQVKEAVLAWAGKVLGCNYEIPIFQGPAMEIINQELKKANLPAFGLTKLYDGLTGEPFEQKVTCGVIYILKLNHLVRNKIHARATGPYALITQQPLGGRPRKGGQKFGEMEGWALASYGAAYAMREMLTVKSDDVYGRQKTQEAIFKGNTLPSPYVSEAVKLLTQILHGLCLNLEFS